MAKLTLFFCLGVVLLFTIKMSAGLSCYNCEKCNDPFDSNGVQVIDCTGLCSKTKAKISGEELVARGCDVTAQNEGCGETEVLGETGTVCFCNTDRCNGVGKQTATVTFIVALATFVYKLFI